MVPAPVVTDSGVDGSIPRGGSAPSNPNPSRPAPAKNWCFTLNSPEAGKSAKQLVEMIHEKFDTQYVIGGLETAPSTGRKHLQGFLMLKKKQRLTALTKILQMHFIVARGSPQENRTYCSKEGNFHEAGELPGDNQGKRSDIKAIKELVKNGATRSEVVNAATSFQSAKMGLLLIQHKTPPAVRQPPEVIWCHGATGSGKSRWAFNLHPDAYAWPGSVWFDGYEDQKVAILDDFRPKDLPFNTLLKVLDRYKLQLPIKGGHVWWQPQKIIITAPGTPEETFGMEHRGDDINQLLRRITQVKSFPLPADEQVALEDLEKSLSQKVQMDPDVDPEVEGNNEPRLQPGDLVSNSLPLDSQDSVFEADTQEVFVDDEGHYRPVEKPTEDLEGWRLEPGGYLRQGTDKNSGFGSPTTSEMEYWEHMERAAMYEDSENLRKRKRFEAFIDLCDEADPEPTSSLSSGDSSKTNGSVEETSSMEADGSDFEMF